MKKNKIFSSIFITILLSLMPNYTFALNDFYSSNDILFYNGSNLESCLSADSVIDGSLTGYERLKQAVRVYGETAMQMQKTYGTPWEVVLAQMQMESQVGTDGIAIQGAVNNWLGLTGSGDAGSWTGESGRKWAKYSSVNISIQDWAGPRVLRNGYYDEAFNNLDPNNYNLDAFLTEMLSHYAPNSDNNDESAYKQNVLSFISGPIAEARAEKGWPSSAELAKNSSISIGGTYAIGATIPDVNYQFSGCIASNNGNINKTAISLAWPDRTHAYNDPKPEYKAALEATGVSSLGDQYSMIGASCDAFVATVMRYSGVDKDFPCCGIESTLLPYIVTSGKYTEVQNLQNTSNLQPGDIFIISTSEGGHIMMYVKLDDGTDRIASASHGDRTADYFGNMFYSDSRGLYRIFRYTGGN